MAGYTVTSLDLTCRTRWRRYNPPVAQDKQTIQVAASWVGHSRDVYAASVLGGVAIAAGDMDPTATEGVYPERAPMKVKAATFTLLTARQSSDVPCDNNTITITFAVWTPYTLHPTPYTLHPTPYTLHPTPYTRHPTPNTLHPLPSTGAGAPRLEPRAPTPPSRFRVEGAGVGCRRT